MTDYLKMPNDAKRAHGCVRVSGTHRKITAPKCSTQHAKQFEYHLEFQNFWTQHDRF